MTGKAKFTGMVGAAIVGICAVLILAMDFHAQAAELKVGIIGDQTWSRDLAASYRIMEQGISLLMEEEPDIIVHTGDMVESSSGEAEVARNFREASALLDRTGIPWYLAAGDHDVNPPKYVPDSEDRSREKLFLSLCKELLPAKDRLYYSFDRGPYHFIVLYSGEHLHTDPRWGNVFLSRIGDGQYEWLRRDLETHSNREGIVIFVHHPLWYNRAGWLRVHNLLREYPVIAVVAGHFHYNQDEGTLDGIRYVVVGATGAETKRAGPEAGGVHHVTVMTLDGKRAGFRPIAISPSGAMAFSVPEDMDRVQALDYAGGYMDGNETIVSLFIKEGRGLVGDCATESPARLTLGPLGNPTDVPLSITVRLRSTSLKARIVSSAFDKDACVSADSLVCVMRPSHGTVMANTSSVVVDRREKPLWEGVVSGSGDMGAAEGHRVSLHVDLSFTGVSGKTLRLFHETPEIPVRACPKETSGPKTAGDRSKETGKYETGNR